MSSETSTDTAATGTAASAAAAAAPRRTDAYWREAIEPYERSDLRRSVLDLATSVLPYLALSVLMYLSLDAVSYWWTLLLAIPTGGFLVRSFIVFHDCTHGSFFSSKKANKLTGTITGLMVFTPFESWRKDHIDHHGTSGDLDRRGQGDVPMLTVEEYHTRPWLSRLGYRLFRNPLIMFGIGPIWSLIINPRFLRKHQRPAIRHSIIQTNLILLVLIGGLCWLIGWQEYLLVQGPAVLLAGATGVWLFYVQHQFEDAYWERSESWSFTSAALEGSAYLRLPQPLQFFTGNIGLHHVHHLSARVPNYNLQRAHDELEIFAQVPVVSLWAGIKAPYLKLWDERSGRIVGFPEARRSWTETQAQRTTGQPALDSV